MGQGFAAQPCGLAEQEGIAYAKTVAEAMNLKLDVGNPAEPREIALSNSRSCGRKKNAETKRRFPQSLTAISITG